MGKMQEVWTQPLTTAVFFFGGVAYDTLTLTRIDRLLDQLILLLYLSLLGALIVLTGRAQLGLLPQAPDSHRAFHPLQLIHRVQPHIPKALQFLFGGLFSAYAIYYFQSASLTTTAVFLGFIVMLLIVNEWFHNHVSSLTMLLALFAIVMMSFLTFFLPVVLGRMNAWIFLVGAGLSAVIVWRLLSMMYRGAVGATTWAQWRTGAPALAMITLMIGFYFLNWIPPVPLSLKFAGMYHQVQRVDGSINSHLRKEHGTKYGSGLMNSLIAMRQSIASRLCSRRSRLKRRFIIIGPIVRPIRQVRSRPPIVFPYTSLVVVLRAIEATR